MSSEQPLISIIMNCYNSASYLREALESVLKQTYRNWEIIFWDNQSTDESASIFKSCADPRLRYFLAQEHTTLGEARNYAISKAQGVFIAFLDCDDRWLEPKLEWQLALFNKDPDLSFVYGNCYLIDSTGKRRRVVYKKTQPRGDVFRSFLKYYPVNLQTVMLRRACLEKLDHVFDPKLEVSEEYDLFMRVLWNGKAEYLDGAAAEYRIHNAMSSIQKIEKYPLENEYILNKFCSLSQDFEKRYCRELRCYRAKIAYWHATAEMRKGSKTKARKYLALYRWHNLTFFFLYCLTFFPRYIWLRLQEKRRGF